MNISNYFMCFHTVAPYNVIIMGENLYNQGEQLQLNCSSEGGPELNYSWLFEGNTIANTSILDIDVVNATNGGDYTCNVTNAAGANSNNVTVYSKFVVYICMYVYIYLSKHPKLMHKETA